jgi:hypothetical protein
MRLERRDLYFQKLTSYASLSERPQSSRLAIK